MKGSTKRLSSIFLSAVFIIGALIMYASFIKPIYKTIAKERGEVAAREKILNDSKAIIDQLKSMLSDYQNLSALQDQISLSLPKNPSTATAFYQLAQLASNSGLSVESVGVAQSSIGQSQEKDTLLKGVGSLKFTLRTTGSYEALKLFLAKIENNVRIFDSNSFKIAPAGGEKGTNAFNFDIEVDAYYLGD